MAEYQKRGNKYTRNEIAFLKTLFNRHHNDREVSEMFEEVVGKPISNTMVNHIRNGYRWKNVEPCDTRDFEMG